MRFLSLAPSMSFPTSAKPEFMANVSIGHTSIKESIDASLWLTPSRQPTHDIKGTISQRQIRSFFKHRIFIFQ